MNSEPPNSPQSSPDLSIIAGTLPPGDYRYELRRDGRLIATEEAVLSATALRGIRRMSEGGDRYEVDAELDEAARVKSAVLRYSRGPFSRSASYQTRDEFLRGSLSALGGRSDLVVKLGRFREIDADLVLFKALIIAHARARRQARFTGRVASVNPSTLAAASHKQTYRQLDTSGLRWSYEPRMGDAETIEIDERGVIVGIRDNRGSEAVLVKAPADDLKTLSG
jgi:hypothetical protein